MFIIRRLNCIDAASGIFTLSHHLLSMTIPDAASIQFNLLMMSIKCSKHVEDYNKSIVKQSKCVSSWSLSKIILRCMFNKKNN